MRQLGIHQGLAPVLDVIADPRWGRVDECIGEDPYLVGTVGTAYVKGLQSAGIHATLKHFVGYSNSRAGRNHAPVYAGPREIADTYLPPFEMAIADGGAKSVMNAYVDVDGVPMAANTPLLTDVLHDRLGFDGVAVADYFAVAFLQVMHAVAKDRGEAAALALEAGIDVELPTGDAYLAPLAERIRAGEFDEAYVDRAVLRVLRQKEELGLLEADAYEDEPPTEIDLDSPEHRRLARKLAEESVVLLANDGVLPLNAGAPRAKVAVIGPNAHRAEALQGCYSFANHVLAHHPEFPLGFEIPTVFEALPQAFEGAGLAVPELVFAVGSDNESDDTSGFAEATAAAAGADLAIVVVGDQAGLFGRGTVGEGNDTESLDLPGVQRQLVEAVVATGTPTVLVLLTGRPYAIAWAFDGQSAPAAVLQAFFPGEGGGLAIADVLTGAANPSGRLPVSLPRSTGGQPYTYRHPILGGPSDVTSTDSTPLRPFGYGLGYTSFRYEGLEVPGAVAAGGSFEASVTVTNTGARAGADIVQLYGHDVVGTIVRPVEQLIGYARVELEPGESKRVTFTVPTTRFAFTDRSLTKIVEPGDVALWVAAHARIAPAADAAVEDSTGGAIVNDKKAAVRELGGQATPRAVVAITGEAYPVTLADARIVDVAIG
jgi:beta-glucosidase